MFLGGEEEISKKSETEVLSTKVEKLICTRVDWKYRMILENKYRIYHDIYHDIYSLTHITKPCKSVYLFLFIYLFWISH